MSTQYEAVIGIEVHAQLLTKTKMFCGCSTTYGAPPNTQVCEVCLGLPGALPVPNREAIELAMKAALALNCEVRGFSRFARKNYFYPDLPKGYQISQFELPLNEKGYVEIETKEGKKRIGITRMHVEEDAAKNLHGVGEAVGTLVDYNRGGVPLIETVSEPDMRNADEVEAYLKVLRDSFMFVGANDGNLEEGSFRCDVNISLRPVGQEKFGTRAEIKNVNSFRFVKKAIEFEIERQSEILSSGGRIVQETRTWSSVQGKTLSLRSKEQAEDYRYFTDPDLPPLIIDEEWFARVKAELPESIPQKRERLQKELGLTAYDAQVLTGHPALAKYFEETTSALQKATGLDAAKAGKKSANFVQSEVLRYVSTFGLEAKFPCSAEATAELLALVEKEVINGKIAKDVFAEMVETGKLPKTIVDTKGLAQVTDTGALDAIVAEVIAENPKEVETYRGGKQGLIGFFVGQVMKKTNGQANPGVVNASLKKALSS